MLSSSTEYLQALREGKFLRFLEWPQFIAQHYANDKAGVDADDTLTLLIFEWLNNGFCEEDAKQIAVLFAVHDLESRPIRAGLSYAFISLFSATIRCMIYQNNNLQDHYITHEKMTGKQVGQLMSKQIEFLEPHVFQELEEKENAKFLMWIEHLDRSLVTQAFKQINSITQFRYLVDDYITELENTQIPKDQLRSSRLSVLKSFAKYLNEQMELSECVTDEIGEYVKKIREMQPAPFEEKYLHMIFPLSIIDNAWNIATDVGLKFFSLLKPSSTLVIPDSTTETPRI